MVFGSNVNILPPINKGWRVRSWLQSHIDVWLYFPRKAFSFVSCIKKTIKKKGKKKECIEKSSVLATLPLYDSSLC
jgi:hypothetical protein